jgi:hypothetical protein
LVRDDADVEDDLLLAFRILRSSEATVVRDHIAVALGGNPLSHRSWASWASTQ